MKSPKKNGIGEVVTDYGRRVMRIFKKGLLQRSLFDFYGDIKADSVKIKESSSVPGTPVDGDGGVVYIKSADGKLYFKSNEVSEVELSSQGTNTTYSVSCVDGDNSDEEKIRLTGSDSSTDDVVLEAGTGLSIARDGDKITFTNTVTDTDTVLTSEQVQDIVGAMFSSNTETNITVTYQDADGTIDLVATDTNTQLTTEEVQDIVGAMFTSNTETRISATYEDADGTIDLVVDDMTADTQLTTEQVQDIVGAMFSSNTETRISATYEDSDGTIDLVVDAIPVDLTSDGAGTIHANNVPTLNQSTTGNAATATLATNAQGIAGATDADVTITSDGEVTVKLDSDNDESNQKFKITNNANSVVFSVQEDGIVNMAGGTINIDGSNSNLELNSGSDFILEADNAGGSGASSIQYLDAGGTNRIMLAADSDVVILSNRAANGTVQIRANTSSAGGGGEVTVVTVEDDKVTISQDLDVTGNVLPGITYVKILPSDFVPDDAGRPAMIDDTGSDRWLESHGTAKLFASVDIPAGFKATHVDIYGSATSAVTVYEADVNSKTVTSKGTGNIGTQINMTDVNSDATNYILIELAQASGEEVYGGKLTIAKI